MSQRDGMDETRPGSSLGEDSGGRRSSRRGEWERLCWACREGQERVEDARREDRDRSGATCNGLSLWVEPSRVSSSQRLVRARVRSTCRSAQARRAADSARRCGWEWGRLVRREGVVLAEQARRIDMGWVAAARRGWSRRLVMRTASLVAATWLALVRLDGAWLVAEAGAVVGALVARERNGQARIVARRRSAMG